MDSAFLVEQPLFSATLAAYGVAAVAYGGTWTARRAWVARAATALLWAGVACNAALIGSRWVTAGRPPFKSLFESLVLLALCVAAVGVAIERLYGTRVFGVAAALGASGALLFALGKWDAEIVQLPPALQSAWFVPHVVVYFCGYAALFVAAVASGLRLVKPELTLRAGTALSGKVSLDAVAYDATRFGFILLTVGLFLGSVWAKSAWGDYWMWDPKENWALVTWLVYGAYLHLRKLKQWQGRRAALLSVAAFGIVLFTYLGMSALPTASESEHVYQGEG